MLAIAGGENISNVELEENCPVVQTEQNSARIIPAENDSISHNEQESKRFDEELPEVISQNNVSRSKQNNRPKRQEDAAQHGMKEHGKTQEDMAQMQSNLRAAIHIS